jgi:hypothetical protein
VIQRLIQRTYLLSKVIISIGWRFTQADQFHGLTFTTEQVRDWSCPVTFPDPPDIGLLSNLEHLEIKSTRDYSIDNGRYLQGSLPASIGQWTALTYCDVSENGLTGTLPDSIGNWTALTYFDVSLNDGLNGTLPDSIDQWTALTYFGGRFNAWTGTIPSSIGNWSLIQYADFSGTSLVGTLPDAICHYIDPVTDSLYVNCGVNCTCCTAACG